MSKLGSLTYSENIRKDDSEVSDSEVSVCDEKKSMISQFWCNYKWEIFTFVILVSIVSYNLTAFLVFQNNEEAGIRMFRIEGIVIAAAIFFGIVFYCRGGCSLMLGG